MDEWDTTGGFDFRMMEDDDDRSYTLSDRQNVSHHRPLGPNEDCRETLALMFGSGNRKVNVS